MNRLTIHAIAAYQTMGVDESYKDAKYLLQRIKNTGREEISKRDLFDLCKGKFRTVEAMSPALQTIIAMGYVRQAEQQTGGRPTTKIFINPLILP